jgi:hypothetical protein
LEVLIYSGGWEAQKLRKYRFLGVKLRPFPFTEAPKGLTATHMDYRSRNMEYRIRISLPQYNKKFLKIKAINRLII